MKAPAVKRPALKKQARASAAVGKKAPMTQSLDEDSTIGQSLIWNMISHSEEEAAGHECLMSKTEARHLMDRFDTIRKLLNEDRQYRNQLAELDHRKCIVNQHSLDTDTEFIIIEDTHFAESLQGTLAQANEIMKNYTDQAVLCCSSEAELLDTGGGPRKGRILA